MIKDKRAISPQWDIGIFHAMWDLGFPTIVWPCDPLLFGGPEIEGTGSIMNDWAPDISYNYNNSDRHLVYTSWVNEFPIPRASLVYQRAKCPGPFEDPIFMSEGVGHQQWIPRIAVGNASLPIDDVVAVAYTEWFGLTGTPQLGAAYWSAWEEPDPVFYHLPYDPTQPAGLPRISITPWNAPIKYVSIAFTQKTGDDTYQAMEINNIRNAGSNYLDYFWPIENKGNEFGIFPSTSCHNQHTSPKASICYYEMVGVNNWRVSYARFNPEIVNPSPYWQYMNGAGATVYGLLEPVDFINFIQTDTFKGSEIVAVDNPPYDHAFWIAWCDFIDAEATTVYAAFGDSST